MASKKVIERSLIVWLLSFGVFLGWAVYLIASPERPVSADKQVSGMERTYPASMSWKRISQSR
jgi:hypothetical protein